MLFLDWKFTLHDNDLVKVNTMCDLAGVDVAYPMLDHGTSSTSACACPATGKSATDELRWFYKRAMRGFLPRRDHRQDQARLRPAVRRLDAHARRACGACPRMRWPRSAERGYFRREFLREALRLHREGHASYYGELVWILMVLELWLQAHFPNARL